MRKLVGLALALLSGIVVGTLIGASIAGMIKLAAILARGAP